MTDTLPPITSAALADIKAKAKAATPGPWQPKCALIPEDGEYDYAIGAEVDGKQRAIAEVFGRLGTNTRVDASLTANFIAAANPQTILRLIAMIERRDEQIKNLRTALVEQIECFGGEVQAREDYDICDDDYARLVHANKLAEEALAATEPPK